MLGGPGKLSSGLYVSRRLDHGPGAPRARRACLPVLQALQKKNKGGERERGREVTILGSSTWPKQKHQPPRLPAPLQRHGPEGCKPG